MFVNELVSLLACELHFTVHACGAIYDLPACWAACCPTFGAGAATKIPIGGAENIVATCWNSRAARKASVVVLRAKRALVLVIDCRHKREDHANYHVATTLLVIVMYACCWRDRRLRSVSMLLDNQRVSGNFCCENQK